MDYGRMYERDCCKQYIIQIMNGYESYDADIVQRLKMECSIQ